MERTLTLETLNKVGEEVVLQGWVANFRGQSKMSFLDLRDKSGIVQCVYMGKMKGITIESVVEILGIVKERPEEMQNKKVATGAVEIEIKEYKVLNECKPIPIPVSGDGYDITEDVRFRYRYVDLRRDRMRSNIKKRSEITRAFREALYKRDFMEVETPILSQATMEGARDFVVPSRLYPGKFYALPQSPQQYKQLLMTGGIDRYFQIARCFRDEDLRADRGFELTQIDLEVSFTNQKEIMEMLENVVKESVKAVGGILKDDSFPVFTYNEALQKYGDDKFDLRTDKEKEDGVLAFAWVIDFPFFKKVDSEDAAEVRDGKSGWTFTHNPFSMPKEEHLQWHMDGENLDKILTTQYDLVCNGLEVGGGSIRAHKAEILRKTYEIMGYSPEETEASIGHMLEAFDAGTPPHGGIAFGLDRFAMIVAGETSMKEVVPFPMTYRGNTSVVSSPNEISQSQLDELGLEIAGQSTSDSSNAGEKLRDKIIRLLDSKDIEFDHLIHEETPTSDDSSTIRGTTMEEGIKALILKGKKSGKNYQFNVPSNMKADMNKISEIVGEKCEFEKPDVIEKKYGIIIGGVPPFGNLMGMDVYFDKRIVEEERSAFNCGLRTESIIMKSADLIKVINPVIDDFAKE